MEYGKVRVKAIVMYFCGYGRRDGEHQVNLEEHEGGKYY